MEAFHFACLFLSFSTGEIFGYEIQPVDAVLFIDGAPTYMRMTNSASLENVYACILENSRNVDSVIMATQMRGLIMDVGQLEENANESIRRLFGGTGRSLWKSEEDAKMMKARLARFLTIDYHDSRNDPGAYFSSKFQRSTDWSHGGGELRTYSGWRESLSPTPQQAKGSLLLAANHNPFFVTTAKTNQTSSFIWASISPTEGTTSKTSTVITNHYPSRGTATIFGHIPAGPSKLSPSSKPFSSDKYVKAKVWRKGSDVTGDITKKPENVSHTLDNTLDRDGNSSSRNTLATGHAPLPEFRNVVGDASAAPAFKQMTTKEGDAADWSSTKSSGKGGGKTMMVSAEGEIGPKSREI